MYDGLLVRNRGREGRVRKTKYGNIEAERARIGLSKDDFAKSLGISIKTYYNWLNGTTPISIDALMKMSNIFNVSLEYLLGLTDIRRRGVREISAKTCDLIAELEVREGVEKIMAEPYQKKEVSVEGPAVILVVTD